MRDSTSRWLSSSIHYTKLAVEVFLKSDAEFVASGAHGKLVRYINRWSASPHPVLDVLCRFQNSLLFAFWERWRYEGRSIAEGGFDRTYKEVVAGVKKNPIALIDAFEAYLRGVKDARSGSGLEFMVIKENLFIT